MLYLKVVNFIEGSYTGTFNWGVGVYNCYISSNCVAGLIDGRKLCLICFWPEFDVSTCYESGRSCFFPKFLDELASSSWHYLMIWSQCLSINKALWVASTLYLEDLNCLESLCALSIFFCLWYCITLCSSNFNCFPGTVEAALTRDLIEIWVGFS